MHKKRIDRRFQLSDDSVNVYDFRLLSDGFELASFQKNPIGYFMHDREGGVLLHWADLVIEDSKVYGYPVINLSHPRASQTINEIESGFLNAASVGHIVALEISTNPQDKLPNQQGPTITKWYCKECSLVDIPGNTNSLAPMLSDSDGNPINLADYTPKKEKMKKIEFTAAMLAAMSLSADAPEADVNAKLHDLVAKADRVDAAETELKNYKETALKAEVKTLCDAGVAEGKITVETAAKLSATYSENPAGLKDLLSSMPKYVSVAAQVEDTPSAKRLSALMAKSWDTLDKAGELPELKALDPKAFEEKRAEAFPSK